MDMKTRITAPSARISMTMRQANEASGLSVRMLYTLIAQGGLASVKVGKRRLVIAKSLEDLLLGKVQRQSSTEPRDGH